MKSELKIEKVENGYILTGLWRDNVGQQRKVIERDGLDGICYLLEAVKEYYGYGYDFKKRENVEINIVENPDLENTIVEDIENAG